MKKEKNTIVKENKRKGSNLKKKERLAKIYIKNTSWYKSFLKEQGKHNTYYATNLLYNAKFLYIYKDNELGFTSYVILSEENMNFVLESKKTIKEAKNFCKFFKKRYIILQ